MKKRLLFLGLFIVILLLVSSCNLPPVAYLQEQIAIRQTSVTQQNFEYEVADVFADFYFSTPQVEAFIGEPISHVYTNPDNGSLTQYFEHIRLETQLDEYQRLSIVVSDLGRKLYDDTDKEFYLIDQNCTHYGDNEIPVCHEFRSFYESNNGDVLLGPAISHVFRQNNRYYQYFANACLVWDPMQPFGNAVSLTPLGETYLSSREPLRYTITGSGYPALMIVERQQENTLNVQYGVEHPISCPDWEQTVSIYVSDENGNPVSGAVISAWVILPNGYYEIYRPADTNDYGISSFTIPPLARTGVERDDVIKLRIEVDSNDGGFGQTTGWFRIWL